MNSETEIANPGAAAFSPFVRTVISLLEHVHYRRINSGEDLEAIYRLRYKAYRAAGFIGENESRKMVDAYDDLPNCHRFGVYYGDNLVSTIRIHTIDQTNSKSPVSDVFGDSILPMVASGARFVTFSLLAADPEWSNNIKALPYLTLRPAVIAAQFFDADFMSFMVRREHANFYARVFHAKEHDEKKGPLDHLSHSVPVKLMTTSVGAALYEHVIRRFPFFGSTKTEQRLLFGNMPAREQKPLAIPPAEKNYWAQPKIAGLETARIFFEDARPKNEAELIRLVRLLLEHQGYSEFVESESGMDTAPLMLVSA